MLRTITLLFLLCLPALAQDGVISNAFFSMPAWGTQPTPDMVLVGPLENNADIMYYRDTDSHWLIPAKLKYVVYVYNQDKFTSVVFALKDGQEPYKFYLDLLTHFHGAATPENGSMHWRNPGGSIPHIELQAYSEDKGNSFIYYAK